MGDRGQLVYKQKRANPPGLALFVPETRRQTLPGRLVFVTSLFVFTTPSLRTFNR